MKPRKLAYLTVEMAIFVDEDDESLFIKEHLEEPANYGHFEFPFMGIDTVAHIIDVDEVVIDTTKI